MLQLWHVRVKGKENHIKLPRCVLEGVSSQWPEESGNKWVSKGHNNGAN